MNKKIVLIFGLLFVSYWTEPLMSQEEELSSDFYINKANQQYQEGNFDGVITSLEDALAFDPGSVQAKLLLVKILVEKSTKYYLQKEYDQALPLIERAQKLAPKDKKVKEIYNLVITAKKNLEIALTELEKKKPKPEPEKKLVEDTRQGMPVRVKVRKPKPEPEKKLKDVEKIVSLLDSFKKSQEKLLKKYSKSPEMMRETMEKLEKERRRYFIITLVSLTIGLVCFILYIISRYRSAKREEILMNHKERLLGMVEHQDVNLAKGVTKLLLEQSFLDEKMSSREMMDHPNAHIRAKGVELLEGELKFKNDPLNAVKLLLPFLKDPHNRVKANAAKALYKYNPELAISILNEMFDSSNRWMQSSAVWVLSEIRNVTAVQTLLNRMSGLDRYVLPQVLKTFQKIIDSPAEKIPEDLLGRIKNMLLKETEKKGLKLEEETGDISDDKQIQEVLQEIPGKLELDLSIPENQKAVSYLIRGVILFKDKKYNEAILELKECIRHNSTIWQTFEYLGNCYYSKRKIKEATNYYEKVLELKPDEHRVKKLLEERVKEKKN